jgi:hypothetical protein
MTKLSDMTKEAKMNALFLLIGLVLPLGSYARARTPQDAAKSALAQPLLPEQDWSGSWFVQTLNAIFPASHK